MFLLTQGQIPNSFWWHKARYNTPQSHEYLVAAANATALAAVASSIFFLFLSSASCFSARARASCSAFSLFSSWEMVCLSFCLAWTALWSLKCGEKHSQPGWICDRILCTSWDVKCGVFGLFPAFVNSPKTWKWMWIFAVSVPLSPSQWVSWMGFWLHIWNKVCVLKKEFANTTLPWQQQRKQCLCTRA